MLFQTPFWTKLFPHSWQLKARSRLWIFKCSSFLALSENILEHISQVRFSSLHTPFSTWSRRRFIWTKDFLHKMHENFRAKWVLSCAFKPGLFAHFMLQTLQEKSVLKLNLWTRSLCLFSSDCLENKSPQTSHLYSRVIGSSGLRAIFFTSPFSWWNSLMCWRISVSRRFFRLQAGTVKSKHEKAVHFGFSSSYKNCIYLNIWRDMDCSWARQTDRRVVSRAGVRSAHLEPLVL